MEVRGGFRLNQINISSAVSDFRHFKSHYRGLFTEPMRKMFLRSVLFCLCLWRLDGVFGYVVSVYEGDSFTLNSNLTEMKDDDVIQWMLENTLIAEINKRIDRITEYDDVLDGRFRDRLKLDNQTGSLTITNITTEHAGVYELQINDKRTDYYLTVTVSVKEGDSFTINTDLTEMKDDDLIQWRFGNENTLIAEINKRTNRISVYDDVLGGRFRDRLKLDNQTGSLTIADITMKHAGDYEVQINNKRRFFHLAINAVFADSLSVKEGHSFTLNSDLTEMKDDDVIQWRFGDESTLIAEINVTADRMTVYDDVLDGRFRDRLKLDNQTGSLTITNTKPEHAGGYQLQINNNTDYFYLNVIMTVKEGDSVTIKSGLTAVKDDDLIRWWFRNTLIAEINATVDRITIYDFRDFTFGDRLKLDNQTGSLTITNTTMKYAGVYQLQINNHWVIFHLAVIVSVNEGDSVTLNSDLTEMKDDDLIRWRFGNEKRLIAEINKRIDRITVYDDVLDGRFRDRLKLDDQTGSLTITNITTEHAGDYKLEINNKRGFFHLIVMGI